MKQFGRGRGRSGRFPFQDTNEKRYALRKVKTEKLKDSGHLVSPESKKNQNLSHHGSSENS